MRIVLAGHNVDVEVLRELKKEILEPAANDLAPERIASMSEEELRAKAGTFLMPSAAWPIE